MEMMPREMMKDLVLPHKRLIDVARWCAESRSDDLTVRRAAEEKFTTSLASPGYGIALLALIASKSQDIDIKDRIHASIRFKNLLICRWPKPSAAADGPTHQMCAADRAVIKSRIVGICVAAPSDVQPQVSHALAVVSASCLLSEWDPAPLPPIFSCLSTALSRFDFKTAKCLLVTAASLMYRFRNASEPADKCDLVSCRQSFADPLLDGFLAVCNHLRTVNLATSFQPVLECLRLFCEIFHSLYLTAISSPDSASKSYMSKWTVELYKFLTTSYPVPEEANVTLCYLRTSVCDILQGFMANKCEDQFEGCLDRYVGIVEGLIIAQDDRTPSGQLTVSALRFLTMVVERKKHSIFNNSDALKRVFSCIIVPNLLLRDEDVQLFKEDWVEYIKRDKDGNAGNTTQKAVWQLLYAHVNEANEQVLALVLALVQQMIDAYTGHSDKDWRYIDAAINLAINVGALCGIDILLPELLSDNSHSSPLLKVAALKFLTKFKAQITKQNAVALLPTLVSSLKNDSSLVRLYGAACLESMLNTCYDEPDIKHISGIVVEALSTSIIFPDSYGSTTMMKCIFEVMYLAGHSQSSAKIIACLLGILNKACDNPEYPDFNNFLFEALAVAIGWVSFDRSLFHVFEQDLFPLYNRIINEGVWELWPYALQIMAEIVNLKETPLPKVYMEPFEDVILDNETWNQPAFCPALALLLRAYLQKIPPNDLVQSGQFKKLVEAFEWYFSKRGQVKIAFNIITVLIETLPNNIMVPKLPDITKALFERSKISSDIRITTSLMTFISLHMIRYSMDINELSFDQYGPFIQLLWIPCLKLIKGTREVKLVVYVSVKLICEHNVLLIDHPDINEMAGKLLNGVISVLLHTDIGADATDPDESGGFVRLTNAVMTDIDLLGTIDLKEFLVSSLAKISATSCGRFPLIIGQYLESQNKSFLDKLCQTYGCRII